MQSYSIVLLDIDGTLIDDERKISTNTKCLLERLEKQGIPVILCSERYPDGVEFFVHQANLYSPIVCYSGNLILDSNRSILQDYGIKTSDAISFKKYANKYFPKVVVSTYLYNVWLIDDADHPVIHMEANMIQCVPLCAPIENALRNSDHVHSLSCIGSPQEISALQKSASPLFEDIQFLHSGPTSLEVLKKGQQQSIYKNITISPGSVSWPVEIKWLIWKCWNMRGLALLWAMRQNKLKMLPTV